MKRLLAVCPLVFLVGFIGIIYVPELDTSRISSIFAATLDDIDGQLYEISKSVVYDNKRGILNYRTRLGQKTLTNEVTLIQNQLSDIGNKLDRLNTLAYVEIGCFLLFIFLIFKYRPRKSD